MSFEETIRGTVLESAGMNIPPKPSTTLLDSSGNATSHEKVIYGPFT
jgi:hypothetical protein